MGVEGGRAGEEERREANWVSSRDRPGDGGGWYAAEPGSPRGGGVVEYVGRVGGGVEGRLSMVGGVEGG